MSNELVEKEQKAPEAAGSAQETTQALFSESMTAFQQRAEKFAAGMMASGAASVSLHELELFDSKSAGRGKAVVDGSGSASGAASKQGDSAGREPREPRAAGSAAEVKDGRKEKDPFEALRKEMQEQKEKERIENINKVVASIAKDGKLPENFKDMLRDYEPMMFAGFHGDADGLQKFVDDVNAKLKESGSSYSLDMQSSEKRSERNEPFSAYESWTENVISLRDANGKVTDCRSIETDPIPKAGVKF